MVELMLRRARRSDVVDIWPIFEDGIEKRRQEGSDQWQDGYPNVDVIESDIAKAVGYVCLDRDGRILGYVALILTGDSAYDHIDGEWLTTGRYAVVHRMVVSPRNKVKGVATWVFGQLESLCLSEGISSIKVDTNYDNAAMIRVFEKLGYCYCGKVMLRGGERQAYEKVLT